MNNTNTNKVIKKKLKTIQNENISDSLTAEAASFVKKKYLIKQRTKSKDFENLSSQKDEKKYKLEEMCNLNTDIVMDAANDCGDFVQKIKLELKDQKQLDKEYYYNKAYSYIKTFERDYKRLSLIYNSLTMAQEERQRLNEEEIDKLNRRYNQLQVEKTDIKRKFWCRYCEFEATYRSSLSKMFYCSRKCEEKQNNLVRILQESCKPEKLFNAI